MPLDPKIIREAQEAYRQWNEAELRERLHAVNKPSTQEAWRQYVALVEFCWKLAPQLSAQQRTRKVADLSQYYDRIHKLEAWRQRQRIDRVYALPLKWDWNSSSFPANIVYHRAGYGRLSHADGNQERNPRNR